MSRCAQFKKVTHVIFDMDGVLLDTEPLYTRATQNVVGKYGKTYDWVTKSHVMGLKGREASHKMVEMLDLPITPEELYDLLHIEYEVVMQETQLLKDTELGYKNAIVSIAKRFGKKYTPEIQGKVIGTVERESSRIAVTEMKLPMSVDDFQLEFRTTSHKMFEKGVPLMPGAAEIVRHLHHNKVPIAVATSSSQSSYELKAKNHKDFFSLFSHIVCGGSDPEVKHGKPNPDIFLVCASRFADKPCPDKCLVFEDAPNGVKAAVSAGMQVIMIPDENVPEELRKDADLVINSFHEAPLEKFGLPALGVC